MIEAALEHRRTPGYAEGADDAELRDAVRDVLREVLSADVILIDGRSGSGKTSFAAGLADALRGAGRSPQTLHVEDLYPGWDGLSEGSRLVSNALANGSYRRYDWVAEEFGGVAVPILRCEPLIIEGCGALTRENIAAARDWVLRLAEARPRDPASLGASEHPGSPDRCDPSASTERRESKSDPEIRGIWIECPAELRRERALRRDGDTYAPHWERWASQEVAHNAEHTPWALADRVLRTI